MSNYQVRFRLHPQLTGTQADNFTIIGRHINGSPSDTTIATNVTKAQLISGVTYTVVDTITGGTITSTGVCTNWVNWLGLNCNFGVNIMVITPTPTPTPTPTATPIPTATPTPTPTPIPVELNEDTEINIFFDNSGSMNTTYNPLVQMQSTILQNCLLPFYNNDINLYNQKVRVISVGGSSPYGYERPIKWISTQPTGNNNVINLAFSDESNAYEAEGPSTGGWIDGSPTGNSDIATLRSVLNNAPTPEYLRGVIFVVNTGPGSYPNFGAFMDAVFNGVNYYAGTNGLSDRLEVSHVPDVTPGSTPQYYVNLIVNSLNSLGYNLPNC
jgi:hypothetical protein